MSDIFEKYVVQPDSPCVDGFNITANDILVFPQVTRALYVGVGGNVHVQMANKAQTNINLVFAGVTSGSLLPIRIQKVHSANTTAGGLIGLF